MIYLQMFTVLVLLPLIAVAVTVGIFSGIRKDAPPDGSRSKGLVSFLAVTATALMVMGAASFGAGVLQKYGFSLFLALPFLAGLFSTLLLALSGPRSYRECLAVSLLAVAGAGLGLFATGFEGAVCLVMALPLTVFLAAAGVATGLLLRWLTGTQRSPAALLVLTALAAPLLMGAESAVPSAPPVYAVRTAVEIDAPPEVVWRHVVSFPALPADREWLFHTGIAYPLRAEIRGQGAGAVRFCVFSTGAFVEPIEVWDEPRLLRFSVAQSPPAMEEMSPYAIRPPHVEGFLVSRRGQFALEPLPGGRTRLVGTTWYQHDLQPAGYWRLWSDWILHRIHRRVLEHVKSLAEAPARVV